MNSEVQPAIFGRFSRVVGAFSHTITVIPFRCHFGDMIIRQKAVVASVGDGHLFQTGCPGRRLDPGKRCPRSEEHTSELQSHHDLVCRLLLEKKKTTLTNNMYQTSV